MTEILQLGVLRLSLEACFREHSFRILDSENSAVSQDTLDSKALIS